MGWKPHRVFRHFAVSAFLCVLVFSAALSRQAPGKVDFRRDVQPIFKQYCIDCHGPSLQMNGFRLDRRSDAMRGGTIPVIAPGSSASSRLYLKLIGSRYGPQMPPTGPLSEEQIGILKAWLDQGAEWPDDLAGEKPSAPPDPRAVQVMEALRAGGARAFKRLVSQDPKVGNLRGPGGTTPLMQASLYGDKESVRLLLAGGADPNIRNDAGATALMWAVADPEKVRLLLDRGADVNARSEDGRTALLIASSPLGSIATAKLLLDRGANMSAKSPGLIGPMTPISEAARSGDEARLRLLIDRGADLKSAGFQPLAFAEKSKCAACLDTLMERADPQTLSMAGVLSAPPLGNAREVKAFLDRGASANAKDPAGHTLLMLAASSDALPAETVKALIERGADLNARDPQGRTALDFAKLRGSTPIVDLLSQAGAKEGVPANAPALTPKPARNSAEAVERSIPLLQKSDSNFLHKSGCVSCHNNTLTGMTMAVARANRLRVNDGLARDQVQRIAAYLEIWRERALQGVAIPGDVDTVSAILVGLAAQSYKPDAATDAMARLVKSEQRPDGGWRIFAHRPPIESNDIQLTAFALRSLKVYGIKTQRAEFDAAVNKATVWLMKAQPRTTEERALQLIGLLWAGVKSGDPTVQKGVRELIAQQRPDGGWAQIPSLASDAYATGEALVALRQAGGVPSNERAYRRGVEFLLKTQMEDGSWYVRSRAIPIQPFFESGFPYGHDQWISMAATNWATMALALDAGASASGFAAR